MSRACLLWGLLIACACDPAEVPPACTPGTSQVCIGRDGCDGVQVCAAEGTGYSVCRCNRDAGAATDAGAGTDAGAATDAGVDGGSDAGASGCGLPDDATTYTFLISRRSLPLETDGIVIGFDLDGVDSGDGDSSPGAICEQAQPDFASPWDAVIGVDNAAQTLVPTLDLLGEGAIEDRLHASIANGSWLTLVRVRDVDDALDDTEVTVELMHAESPMLLLDAAGRPRPGQRFSGMLFDSAAGRIVDGRVEASFGTTSLGAPVGLLVPDPVQGVRLRFDLCREGMQRGVLAGEASVDGLVAEFDALVPGSGSTARALIEDIADIRPREATPDICERLSFAFEIEGVPAVVVSP